MSLNPEQSASCPPRKLQAGSTLVEVVMSIAILALVMAGLICGYVQANWSAEWSSMSLAAQAYASEGAEQVRGADWRPRDFPPTDEMTSGTMITNIDFMDIPGAAPGNNQSNVVNVTNIVTITDVSVNPPLRQIRSDCYWVFPRENTLCTNTVILLRAPDQ
jgi:type II secretory pathway pseudopilin PulG